jgi:tripartite-type tricarboxylate transporter receptor subunit TctC
MTIDRDRRDFLRKSLALSAASSIGLTGSARAFPDRNIRLVVPFAPAGTTDFVARVVADKISETASQRVFVENKTGAAGAVGMREVANAQPDGHTILMTDTTVAISPTLNAKAGINPALFEPVALVGIFPSVFVVHRDVPANSVPELIEHARKNPRKLNFGSGGIGTGPHLQGELFKWKAQIDIAHVPYRGAADALRDVVAGNIQMLFTAAPTAMPQIQAGTIRLLATTGAERLPAAAQAPTMIEAGLPGFVSAQWFGILAPAKTPPAVVARLNQLVTAALADPVVAKKIIDQGGFLKPGSPSDYSRFIAGEVAAWGDIIRSAGVTMP